MADISLGSVVGVPVVLPNSRPWTAYTPVLTGAGSKVFTCTGFYRDSLDSREVIFTLIGNTVAAGALSPDLQMSLPPSSTITASKLPNPTLPNTESAIGFVQTFGIESTGNYDRTTTVVPYSTTSVAFVRPTTASYYNQTHINTIAVVKFVGKFTVAIDELAGGYTSYGAGLATSVKSGLVSNAGGNLPGKIDGTAIAAGYVGELIESKASSNSGTVPSNMTSITLTAGIWDISAVVFASGVTGNAYVSSAISLNTSSYTGTTQGYDYVISAVITTTGIGTSCIPRKAVNITSSTTYYLVSNTSSVTQAVTASLSARRVA